ncbi:MAG: hypothetical protein IJF07_06425 [Lachnospiraceae bacterium]|nr:hypothetical protein [Lachnospiraceae bacterium]
MSYCVNCGVELDASAKVCALCNTPVMNPNELVQKNRKTPFPKEKGAVEKVKRKDWGILLSTVVLATGVTCGALNAFVFTGPLWSLAVIGVCAVLWVIMIPAVIYTKQPVYVSIMFDGLAVVVYLYMLAYMIKSDKWFWDLGLPIVVFITMIVEGITICINKFPRSFLTIALYVITGIGLLCGGLEFMIDMYIAKEVTLRWSAVVITVCVIVDIAIITMLSLRRVRNAVRRRLHF